ncbi:MAG: penicillin-binding transpeptidase domain-containing protein [Armatimonadota bacterium]|nr:penicillin-binding transpeptidase domain-containing protein [Armatimonadota bacterium]
MACGAIVQARFMSSVPVSLRGSFFTGLPLAIIAGAMGARLLTARWTHYWPMMMLGAVFIVGALAVAGTGPGSTRLALMGIQPAEFVRLLVIGFMAGYCALAGNRFRALRPRRIVGRLIHLPRGPVVLPLLVGVAATVGLLLLARDLGPPIMLVGLAGAMLAADTGVWAWALASFGIVGGAGWLAYYAAGHTMFARIAERIDMWLTPWESSHPYGVHVAQSLWAIASGGVRGFGPGRGWPELVARSENDMAFAAVAEQLGMAGTSALFAGIAAIVLGGLAIAASERSRFLRLVAYGISCAVGLQTIVIMAGNTGLLPLTGITLPLVSRGNSSIVATGLALGVLISIGRSSTAPTDHHWLRSIRVTRWLFLGALVIVMARTLDLQTLSADEVALRSWRGPQADGVTRPVANPRLHIVTQGLKRAPIVDRRGRALARESNGRGRVYPYGPAAVHVVGYVAPQRLGGPQGVEKTHDRCLTGIGNPRDRLRVLRGYGKPLGWRPGARRVKLAIDADLQQQAYELLRRSSSGAGAAVLLDSRTGEVLVAATAPSFDPNALNDETWCRLRVDEEDAPLVNRATHGLYAPGSAFKPVVAAAALESGLSPVFHCSHVIPRATWEYNGIRFAREGIHDLEGQRPHGRVDLGEALRVSCNVYFAQLALELGPDAIATYCHSSLGLERGMDRMRLAQNLPDVGYGQGHLLVTPLFMARFMAAVANGGKMPEPVWLSDERSSMTSAMSMNTARTLAGMLRNAAEEGTGRGVFSGLGYDVAGKTGTAQLGAGLQPHSWFAGFAPYRRPEVAFAVIVENGGWGSRSAGPIARRLVENALSDE